MDIVLIGSGNVATVLGRICKQKGHRLVEVTSRRIGNAGILAEELECPFSDFSKPPSPDADIYIMALSDEAVQSGAFPHRLNGRLVVHTAGSIPMNRLLTVSGTYGVFYPLQSLRREMHLVPEIPLLIDGSDEASFEIIKNLALSVSTQVKRASDSERLTLHTAAVIVNNFTNHLYALAEKFCRDEHADFNMLHPLIRETATRISELSPALVQTGPAVRNDIQTVEKHLELLRNYPELQKIYRQLSDSIAAKK